MTPSEPGIPPAAIRTEGPPPPQPRRYRWYHRFTAVVFATLCLEIGLFLLLFPWTNYAGNFAAFRPEWRAYWDNAYVRGAISGLGVVNLYISFTEIKRLRRFSKR